MRCLSILQEQNLGSPFLTSWPSVRQWSLISSCSHQDPLRSHGHWFPYVYMKTFCETMVIDFLSLHRGPLRSNGHRFLYIKTLCNQWSLIFYVTSRPSARQWSSISLHQDPLRGNGHWFLKSHWGPLRGNGHRSLYIKTLYKAMVIDFLCYIEALYEGMVIDLLTSRPSARQWSSISLNQDPLWGNGHRSL